MVKFFWGWLPIFLYVPMNDSYIDYKQKKFLYILLPSWYTLGESMMSVIMLVVLAIIKIGLILMWLWFQLV